MNKFDYKNLTPFKWFVLENFPFIEADFDALTEWQLFCKLGKEINKIINSENTLGIQLENVTNAFIELQNYVNNYFDNLDVQEEINNKLNNMAKNGELTALIKNYLEPILNEQNRKLNNFDNRLLSVENGNPLVANNIEEMTDTSKIYVNTSDGNWYYYNTETSSWTIGGIYQTIELANGSVSYNKLNNELQNSLESNSIPTNYLPVKNKFIEENGNIVDLENYSYFEINVEPLSTLYINTHYDFGSYGQNAIVYCFKNNNELIYKVTKNDISSEIINNRITKIIDIPYNVNKLLINTTLGNEDSYILKVDKYLPFNISKNQLDEKLQNMFENIYEIVTPSLFYNGALIDRNKQWQNIEGYSIYQLNVDPNSEYEITIKQVYNNPIVFFGNPNLMNNKTIDNISYNYDGLADYILSETSGNNFIEHKFITPKYCNKIYINSDNNEEFTIKKVKTYKVITEEVKSPLSDKKILFTGDSICAASTPGVKGWWRLIQENNPSSRVYNYGVDGATIAISEQNPTKNVISYIQTMYEEHSNADYIIIQGGVNDFWNSTIELGEFLPNDNFNGETPYNTNTFSGALEWIFNYCLNNFGGKKVGYIVTPKINAGSRNFYQYMDRAKEICKKWSIPYVDLFNNSDLNYFVTSQKQNYSITTVTPSGDGTHPNLAGYEIITPIIENWLKYTI